MEGQTVMQPPGNTGSPGYFPYPKQDEVGVRGLVALSRALSLLQTLNRNLSIEQAQVFLMVALDEGRSHSEYAEMCGLAQPTISRIFTDMSHYRRTRRGAEEGKFTREEGYGLLEQRANPMEMRQKLVYLTHKGRILANRLARIIAGA